MRARAAAAPLHGALVLALAALAGGCGSKRAAPSAFDPDAAAALDAAAAPGLSGCTHEDCDGDGYAAPADCDDGDPMVNPEAYDFPGDGVDDDCDGAKDDPVVTCETAPASAPGSPVDFARAADLCAQRAKTKDGTIFDPLIKADWGQVKGYGSGQRIWISRTKPEQVAIASAFGANAPRRGATMCGLANGPWGTKTPRASAPLDDPSFSLADACADVPLTGKDCDSLTAGQPAGHGVSVQDWAELTLWVRVPSNARAMTFDFAFFTTEFNQFWDAALNDAFFVLVTSDALHGENVARDASGLAITVNSGFFQLCPRAPGPAGLSSDKAAALAHCVGDDGDPSQLVFGSLKGTGYDGAAEPPYDGTARSTDGTRQYVYGGGSGWLTARFPVTPGESLTMRVIVHDTFDGLKDSAALFDAVGWERAAPDGGGVRRPPR